MPVRRISKSKSRRGPRSAPVEFGLIGLVIGAWCGSMASIVVQLAVTATAPSRPTMLAGALVGLAVGGLVELAGFLRRKRMRDDE